MEEISFLFSYAYEGWDELISNVVVHDANMQDQKP